MAENRWFKVWGREVLASIDLNSLTDHEERVWWRLLAAASNEEPRWTIEVTPVVARFCASTPARLGAALATFERRGMIRQEGNCVTFVNAEKYQETPAAKRKREQRERDRARDSDRDPERDMSRDSVRDMSQDKRVTSHVTSHAPVPGIVRARSAAIAIASEAEAEAEADLAADAARRDTSRAAAAEDGGLSEEDEAVGRLCRAWENATGTTVTNRLGESLADWLELLPEAAIVKAIAETGASNARNWRYCEAILRRYQVEGWADKPKAEPYREPPQQERIPTGEEVFEAIRNRKPVPVPDELEYFKTNDPEQYERELAMRERTRAKLAAHMAAKGQAT
jgi:hypothetical protein